MSSDLLDTGTYRQTSHAEASWIPSAAVAERAGWIVAQVEAGQASSVREAIGEVLHAPLAVLCALGHVAGQRGWRFLLALAGLPSLPRVLTEAKSCAERPTTR